MFVFSSLSGGLGLSVTQSSCVPSVLPEVKMQTEINICDLEKLIDEAMGMYSDRCGQVLNVLGQVQSAFGYIPHAAIRMLSVKGGWDEGALEEVCRFFRGFTTTPEGRHIIEICDGTACHARGSKDVLKAFETALSISCGETTDDLEYTLKTVRCVGTCNLAPIVIADGQIIGKFKLQKANSLVRELK